MANAFRELFEAWSIDIFFGWSIMDIASLCILLWVIATLVNYFFFKADAK
jgi:hypothetical protein